MQIKIYEDAVIYLESFIGKVRFEITPEFIKKHDPLERMRVLLDLLGNPQEKFRSILVGGTSGKGSTAYLIAHILTTAGYKTGLTISPHLQKINERIQINCKSILDKEFTKMVGSIVDTIELMRKKEVGAPSYFEILIAMGFLYFAQEKIDIAVVEVGMGGEYDATNTLYPLIAILTNVSLDHTNVLGGSVEEIARTKAGIIKGFHHCHPELVSGSPARRQVYSQSNEMPKQARHDKRKKPIVVTGVKQPSVIKIVEERCKEVGAKLYILQKDFDYRIKSESLHGINFDFYTCHPEFISGSKIPKQVRNDMIRNLYLALLGKYQVENVSLAIETVLQLGKFDFKISEEDVRKALKTAFFPGRFEIIKFKVQSSKFKVILDGAHNPTKMKAFLTTLKKLYPKQKKVFVVGFKVDKDIPKMLQQITNIADNIIVTEFDRATDMAVSSSADAPKIKDQILEIKYDGEVEVEKDSKKALDKALNLSAIEQYNNSTIIVVTGSLYLVGEIRNML